MPFFFDDLAAAKGRTEEILSEETMTLCDRTKVIVGIVTIFLMVGLFLFVDRHHVTLAGAWAAVATSRR